MAAERSPGFVVDLLDDLFVRYDRLCDRFGVEKIKTIGDAYMAATGLPTFSANHAERMAGFALEMLVTTREFAAQRRLQLDIRIGIHSGTVVAGVIGERKFAYDLWGDTVNLAARMESHGEAGRIQVSQKTAELLRDSFRLERRGPIDVKGKGDVVTYFLDGVMEKTDLTPLAVQSTEGAP